jgi:sugar lactone lactonase YvrE
MPDTHTKRQTGTLTVGQLAGELNTDQIQALADIDAGLVHSLRANRGSAVQVVTADGAAWTVTETVHRLEGADLAERAKGGTVWRLTPAGTLILKRHAGGAR